MEELTFRLRSEAQVWDKAEERRGERVPGRGNGLYRAPGQQNALMECLRNLQKAGAWEQEVDDEGGEAGLKTLWGCGPCSKSDMRPECLSRGLTRSEVSGKGHSGCPAVNIQEQAQDAGSSVRRVLLWHPLSVGVSFPPDCPPRPQVTQYL